MFICSLHCIVLDGVSRGFATMTRYWSFALVGSWGVGWRDVMFVAFVTLARFNMQWFLQQWEVQRLADALRDDMFMEVARRLAHSHKAIAGWRVILVQDVHFSGQTVMKCRCCCCGHYRIASQMNLQESPVMCWICWLNFLDDVDCRTST